ncbi:GcrA family cell cycle regulator [Methylobacterium sp. 37f]|uniref:GcrA family cell cycle regulator n=1 Tax=Methylobacterium sp. 37f TaxID=2817058 RepID=UPI001FFCF7E8|nr:GcrA family cell cycle regulator [Methylobacterium sp. 37f]MCK2057221.1 hypothetical protein [Methylobacterium sp. 37f]
MEEVSQAKWTPEEIERAKELWVDGKGGQGTADELFAQFGVRRSKCSVISRMARCGLSFQGRQSPPALRSLANAKIARGTGRSARRKPATPKPVAVARIPRPAPRLAPRPPADVAIPESRRVALTDLTAGACRWIAGDPRFDATCCGHPIDPGSAVWCTAHRAIGTVGSQRRQAAYVPTRRAA